MSATISPFLNVPVGHSEIKRRFSEEEPQARKRQKLDPPATTASNQVCHLSLFVSLMIDHESFV